MLEWVVISSFRGVSLTQASNPTPTPAILCFLLWQAGSLPLAPPGKPPAGWACQSRFAFWPQQSVEGAGASLCNLKAHSWSLFTFQPFTLPLDSFDCLSFCFLSTQSCMQQDLGSLTRNRASTPALRAQRLFFSFFFFFWVYFQVANTHMERCSTPLIIREMQIKTIMRYLLKPVRMAIVKKSTNTTCWRGCEKKGTL